MLIQNKFSISDIVYLNTDKDQLQRIVTGIKITPAGLIYFLSHATGETQHYEIEISNQVNELMKI